MSVLEDDARPSVEEDFTIVPWIGLTSHKNSLTVVVLSENGDFIDKLSEALVDVHTKRNVRWKLVVLRSHSLENIAKLSDLTGKQAIDFVVIAMDTSNMFCLKWASKVLEEVHPDLRARRVMIVNASGLPVNAMAVNASDLVTFCSENRIDMLNSNVSKREDAQFVSNRILKYIEVSVGLKTGIPNINI